MTSSPVQYIFEFITILSIKYLPFIQTIILMQINNIASIWRENMHGYLSAGIICSWEANSFPRAKLEENCELRGTDDVQGKISVYVFEAKWMLFCLLSFKYFFTRPRFGRPYATETTICGQPDQKDQREGAAKKRGLSFPKKGGWQRNVVGTDFMTRKFRGFKTKGKNWSSSILSTRFTSDCSSCPQM